MCLDLLSTYFHTQKSILETFSMIKYFIVGILTGFILLGLLVGNRLYELQRKYNLLNVKLNRLKKLHKEKKDV
jgi:hypothetical protein